MASPENYSSPRGSGRQAGFLTIPYAEGFPASATTASSSIVDVAGQLAIRPRPKQLFGVPEPTQRSHALRTQQRDAATRISHWCSRAMHSRHSLDHAVT